MSVQAQGGKRFALNTIYSMGAFGCKVVVQLALIPIMARLLGPTEYGIYALALPTVMFFQMLADGGLGASLAREDESNTVMWSTAFWVLLGTCTAMAFAVAASGFALAWFTDQPKLIGVMALLSLTLPIMAVTVTSDARLTRRGNLAYHSGGDVASTLVGAGVAVWLASRGWGAWSLALQYVTAYAVRAAIMNGAAWSTPSLAFDLSTLKGHVSTGGALLVARASETLGSQVQNAVFSSLLGGASFGNFALAQQSSRFMCDAVSNPVIGSFYIHALNEDVGSVVALQARMTRLLAMVLLPAAAVVAVCAPRLLPLALGPKWVAVVPMFQFLVLPNAVSSCLWLGGQILIRHGMSGITAKGAVISAIARISIVAAGLVLPTNAVAGLIGLSFIANAGYLTAMVPSRLGTRLPALLAQMAIPALAAAAGALATALAMAHTNMDFMGTVASLAAGGAAALATLATIGGTAFRSDVGTVTRIVRRRAA